MRMKVLTLDSSALTDLGLVRENNEDSCFVHETNLLLGSRTVSLGIYIVADGMGGHQAGEVASKMAVQIISAAILDRCKTANYLKSPSLLIKEAFNKANAEIYNRACANPLLSAMGTTVTLGLRLDDKLYMGHVGDSRCYLIRGKKIKQLTEDHSVVAHLLKAGMITPEEAKTHPDREKILRCLGPSARIAIDIHNNVNKKNKLFLQANDTLVFCTDGLTEHVCDNEILEYVEKKDYANSICRDLIRLANSRGGVDNISLIVIRIKSSKRKDTA
jgi:serine/threonine protein phosphatase PrpC